MCQHCFTRKTRQWRLGTREKSPLCNACGIRLIKNGELHPEYHLAASETFVGAIHSNIHRRVLELHSENQGTDGSSSSTGETAA
ncbi:hypothetical protein BRADI_2g32792v3 [Brachypodium distachyon]|uniref:GATA-type domain-containing protein n=1 Tax=Brachypodium distachyon TaxID=15368 RepID=A0A2K2DBH4_BRADI|nr:hypothetical protein BRADI_2g32792v3 [Brachypodium distachyon]